MLNIEKIRLKELESFVKSRRYKKMEYIPLSINRVQSYLSNPHAHPGDVVLYLGFFNDKLVAFRSLFADTIHTEKANVRFAWCSGNWVDQKFRRKGYSERLLQEAYTDWNKKLMFTNYAPSSEQLYLKTGWFKPIHRFEGIRAYLFPETRRLIPSSNKNIFSKVFFSAIDLVITGISTTRLSLFNGKTASNYTFESIQLPDKECYLFLDQHQPEHAFRRYTKELKWIFKHPWLTKNSKAPEGKYPFSQFSDDFAYHTVKIYYKDQIAGFFIFSVRDGFMKTLYFMLPDEVLQEVAVFLKSWAKTERINVLTVYKKELASLLFKRKFPFLHVKEYGQKIYSTFELPEPKGLIFQDGDGDVIFT